MTPDSIGDDSGRSPEREVSTAQGRRILVVDDEPAVAKSIKMILENMGHTVEIAEAAEPALKLYGDSKYDLIITDFALGKMTGLDLARAVKARCPSQPIILITAYAESLNVAQERLADFTSVLGKPFSMEEMERALAKAFLV